MITRSALTPLRESVTALPAPAYRQEGGTSSRLARHGDVPDDEDLVRGFEQLHERHSGTESGIHGTRAGRDVYRLCFASFGVVQI